MTIPEQYFCIIYKNTLRYKGLIVSIELDKQKYSQFILEEFKYYKYNLYIQDSIVFLKGDMENKINSNIIKYKILYLNFINIYNKIINNNIYKKSILLKYFFRYELLFFKKKIKLYKTLQNY
jgi:hypothetical protein